MSDVKIIVLKLILLVLLWVGIWFAHKLHCAMYRWQTKDWIPLSKDTVWMSDAGHTLLFPPSPIPITLGGFILSIGILVLQ